MRLPSRRTGAHTPVPLLFAVVLTILGISVPTAAQTTAHVQPGARVQFDGQSGSCALAFLLEGRIDPEGPLKHWVLTSGHCVPGLEIEQSWDGDGPEATVYPVGRIGEAVYAALDLRRDLDVALIALDDGVGFNPAVCYYGGPVALDEDRQRRDGEHLPFVGGAVPNHARYGIASDLSGDTAYYFALSFSGDSGGPIMSEGGRALGIVSGGSVDSNHVGRGVIRAVRLDHQLDTIRHATGLELMVLTADVTATPADVALDLSTCPSA